MASENLIVGTAANANDGDTLRAAFIKVKKMFAEVYGQTYSEQGDLSGVTFEIKEDKLKATNSAVDGYVLTYDSATGGFTWEQKFDGDITSIVAGDGLTGSSLDSGDSTLNVNVDSSTIAIVSDTLEVANNGIGYSKLDGRYTGNAALSDVTTASTVDIDFDNGIVYTVTSSAALELNFTDEQVGDVKTIIVTDSGGTSSLTFESSTNTVTTLLNGTYDATAGAINVVQVICTASNTFFVTISQ
jgi:hypothetical protein